MTTIYKQNMENNKASSYIFEKKVRPLTYNELKNKNISSALPQYKKGKDVKYEDFNNENFFKLLKTAKKKFDDINVEESEYGRKEVTELLGYLNQAIDYKIDITPHDNEKLELLEDIGLIIISLYEEFAIIIDNILGNKDQNKNIIKTIMRNNKIDYDIQKELSEGEKIFCNTFLKIKAKAESDVEKNPNRVENIVSSIIYSSIYKHKNKEYNLGTLNFRAASRVFSDAYIGLQTQNFDKNLKIYPFLQREALIIRGKQKNGIIGTNNGAQCAILFAQGSTSGNTLAIHIDDTVSYYLIECLLKEAFQNKEEDVNVRIVMGNDKKTGSDFANITLSEKNCNTIITGLTSFSDSRAGDVSILSFDYYRKSLPNAVMIDTNSFKIQDGYGYEIDTPVNGNSLEARKMDTAMSLDTDLIKEEYINFRIATVIEIGENQKIEKINFRDACSNKEIDIKQIDNIINKERLIALSATNEYKYEDPEEHIIACHDLFIYRVIMYTDYLLQFDKDFLIKYVQKRLEYYETKYTEFEIAKNKKIIENKIDEFINSLNLSEVKEARTVVNKKLRKFIMECCNDSQKGLEKSNVQQVIQNTDNIFLQCQQTKQQTEMQEQQKK